MLTEGSFTRGDWCNLLCLVNMDLSVFSRFHVRSVERATTLSKRIQEGKKEEEPAVAKPRSVCLISTSLNRGQSSSFGPDVSNILENPQLDSVSVNGAAGNCRRDIVQNRLQNPETCSQVWKGDNQSQRSCGELQRDCVQGNMPKSSGGCGKLQRKIEIQLQTTRLYHHNLQVTDYGYVEKVFTNLRRKLNRTEDDEMFDLKTNMLIWGLLMTTTMKSAIHLGLENDQQLIACQNTNFEGSRLCSISLWGWLPRIHLRFWICLLWCMTSLCGWEWPCAMIKQSDGRKHRYMSNLIQSCLGTMSHPSEAIVKWKEQIQYFRQFNEYAELSGIDGEPIEFEWNIFPGFTSIEILRAIQRSVQFCLREVHVEAQRHRLDTEWKVFCKYHECQRSTWLRKRVSAKTLVIPWSWRWRNWYETCIHKPEGKWEQQANRMIELFAQSGHPVFNRGTLRRKSGRNTVHFTADSGNIVLIMRTIHSANQLRVYGTVSSGCIDLSWRMQGRESTGVNMSISEENEQLSQLLDPQEVGSLARSSHREWWIWESYCIMPRVHLISNSPRFWSKTLDIQVHRDWSSSWCQSYQSS